jgi:hypothetical protein
MKNNYCKWMKMNYIKKFKKCRFKSEINIKFNKIKIFYINNNKICSNNIIKMKICI